MKRLYAVLAATGFFSIAWTGIGADSAGVQTSVSTNTTDKVATFRFASAETNSPSSTLAELGLEAIKTEAVFVVHTRANAGLAAQVARTTEAMNRVSQEIVGSALRIHGLILIANSSNLPPAMRGQIWVNVDGISCLVQQVNEENLPLQKEFSSYMIFPLLAHENVDVGIKAECLGGRLTARSISSRWFVEGIADYCACQASLKYQSNALSRLKKNYIEGLDRITKPTLDIESAESWWPKGSSGTPNDVQYSYAAAHFAIRELSKTNGTAWIRQTLERIKRENTGPDTTSADFARIATPLTGRDVSAFIRRIKVKEVREFASSL
jgi:hypothetical protein